MEAPKSEAAGSQTGPCDLALGGGERKGARSSSYSRDTLPAGQPQGPASSVGARQGSGRGLQAAEQRNPLGSDPKPQSPLTFTDPGGPQSRAPRNGSRSPESLPLSQPQSQGGGPYLSGQPMAMGAGSGSPVPEGGCLASTARVPGSWLGALPSLSAGPSPADGPARLSLPRDGPARRRAGSGGGGGGPRWRSCNWTRRWRGWEGVVGVGWATGVARVVGPPALALLAPRPAGTAASPPPPRSRWSRVPDLPSGQGAVAPPAGSG